MHALILANARMLLLFLGAGIVNMQIVRTKHLRIIQLSQQTQTNVLESSAACLAQHRVVLGSS